MGKSVILSRIVQCVSFFSPLTLALYAILASIVVYYQKKRARLVKLIEKIPGPPSLPIIGNTIEINVDHDGECERHSRSSMIVSCLPNVAGMTKEIAKTCSKSDRRLSTFVQCRVTG